MAEEKLVRLSDVEFYLRQTAKNMIDAADMDAETLTDGEREQIGACVLALRELANNAHRLPTVEAAPVVLARWKRGRNGRTICSACRRRIPTYPCDNFETGEAWAEEIDETPFCPRCGALMDGRGQHE